MSIRKKLNLEIATSPTAPRNDVFFIKNIFFTIFFLLFASNLFAEITPLEPITKNDRVLIIAPHPDDEIIGCGGVIQNALNVGAEVSTLFLTNGDHNELAFIIYEKRLVFRKGAFIYMGKVRMNEAIASDKFLGIDKNKIVFLGYPDFGTFNILFNYWEKEKPYRSLLTRISRVPYKDNFSYGDQYIGQNILNNLKYVLTKYKPTKIFVTHPVDINSDHRAASLFLEIALADLYKTLPRPKVYDYLIHSVGWPLPRDYHPEEDLLPPEKFSDSKINWFTYNLSAEEIEKKRQAILFHKSQTSSSAAYLLSFIKKNELFSVYPDINVGENFDAHVYYEVKDGKFFMHIKNKKTFKKFFKAKLYFLPYSYKKEFENMPKFLMFMQGKNISIFNGNNIVKSQNIKTTNQKEEIVLEMPLGFLGDPDFVLVSIMTNNSPNPDVDNLSFRKININL